MESNQDKLNIESSNASDGNIGKNEIAVADASDESAIEKADKKRDSDEITVGQIHTRNLAFIQRDYINPKNLGFMRIIMFFFAANILLSFVGIAYSVKESFPLDFDNSMLLINLMFDSVSFWLLWRRKRVAKWWIIGYSTFNILASAIFSLVLGQFEVLGLILNCFGSIFLIMYFLIAKRVNIVLNQPFSMATYKREAEEDANCFRPKTWPFWRNVIIYFCVFSVVGHWMEAGYCLLIKFGILPGIYDPNSQIWSDWLYPFLVYGFGCVACILIFYPIKIFLQKRIKGGFKANVINVLITFVIAGIVCCLIELVMGLTMNMDYSLWDYRDMFGNFMGQICLQNGIAFGMIATLMTWVIYPALERAMDRLPKEIGNGLFIAVVVGFSLLWLLYCFQPPKDLQIGDVVSIEQSESADGSEESRMSPMELLELRKKQANEAALEAKAAADEAELALQSGDVETASRAVALASEKAEAAVSANDALADAAMEAAIMDGLYLSIGPDE